MRKWLEQLVLGAGELALEKRQTLRSRLKADGTLVSDIDELVQEYVISRIEREFPHDCVISEESDRVCAEGTRRVWAIDPIDGTRSFVLGFPLWAVSIGLLEEGKPRCGAVYVPQVRDLYVNAGDGPFLNGKPMSPCPVPVCDKNSAFLVTERFFRKYFLDYPGTFFSLGTTAVHALYVGRGAAVGSFSRAFVWDFAGAAAIVLPLGVEFRYVGGKPVDFSKLLTRNRVSEGVFACHPSLFGQFQSALKPR